MSPRQIPASSAGFTLIEMVMSLVLWGLIAALAAHILVTGWQSWMAGRVMTPLVAQGWIAMERMAREARGGTGLMVGIGGISFQFSSQTIGYDQTPPAGQPENAIYRSVNNQKSLLVEHVRPGSLQFAWDAGRRLLTLSFVLEEDLFIMNEPLQIPLLTRVFVRN